MSLIIRSPYPETAPGPSDPPGTADLRVYLAGDINGSMSEDDQIRFALLYEPTNPPPQAGTFE